MTEQTGKLPPLEDGARWWVLTEKSYDSRRSIGGMDTIKVESERVFDADPIAEAVAAELRRSFMDYVNKMRQQAKEPGKITWRWADFGKGPNTVTGPDNEWGAAYFWPWWTHNAHLYRDAMSDD